MEDYIVSLKNIYRILRVKDYPIYSDGVISRSRQKGLTLVKFWKQILLYRWRSTLHGKMIWRTEGSKNRYHSELCNRRETFPFYQEYTDEIFNSLTPSELQRQMQIISDFLQSRRYSHEIFRKKIESFLAFAGEDDPVFSEEAAEYFQKTMEAVMDSDLPELFADSWILAMLSLHGLAGEAMNESLLHRIRRDAQFSPYQLYKLDTSDQTAEGNGMELLTTMDSELWANALSPENFYGREREFYDIRDAVRENKKLLLSGIGGIGKTELLRQFIHYLKQSRQQVRIAAVQYENTLKESFARSFAGLSGGNVEERFHEALHVLGGDASGPTVLLIDNMNNPDEDPEIWTKILSLPCTVLITSRCKELAGFPVLHIEELTPDAASLIFRSTFERILSEREKDDLDRFIVRAQIRHPLTLTLLGKFSGANAVAIEDLFHMYPQGAGRNHDEQNLSVEHQFQDIYKALYSRAGLSKKELAILHVLAILPYRSYERADILSYVAISPEDQGLLDRLHYMGWLEHDADTYAIHPIIAESIRKRHLLEQDYASLWSTLEEKLAFTMRSIFYVNASQAEAALLFCDVVRRMEAPLSEELARIAIESLLSLRVSMYANVDHLSLMEQLFGKCTSPSLVVRTYREIMYLLSEHARMEEAERIREELKRDEYHAELALIFDGCLATGYIQQGQYQDALDICEIILRKEDIPDYYRMYLVEVEGNCLTHLVRYQDAINLYQENLAWLDLANDYEKTLAIWLYLHIGDTAFWKGNYDLAKESMAHVDALSEGQVLPFSLKIERLSLLSEVAVQEEKLEEAAEYIEESRRELEIFCGRDSRSWIIMTGRLAILYNKLGGDLRQRSYQYHEMAIDYCEKLSPDSSDLQIFLNNYAVALLDGEEPDKALPVLERAYRMAEGMPPLAKAEPAWNLSRVWRARGDAVKEWQYLSEALSVFREQYGEEHPKTRQALERAAELEN